MAKRKDARPKSLKFQRDPREYDPRYFLPNIRAGRGWESEAEQRAELRRLKKNVKARLKRLEASEYSGLGSKLLQETPFADVLADPLKFTMEEQLAAFARIYEEDISISGLKKEKAMRESWAEWVGGIYSKEGRDIGFNEIMAAARYAGLVDQFGSERVARLADGVEEKNLDGVQVLENIGSYLRGA